MSLPDALVVKEDAKKFWIFTTLRSVEADGDGRWWFCESHVYVHHHCFDGVDGDILFMCTLLKQ